MLANLEWSDTDNFFMNLGCQKVSLVPRVTCPLQGVGLVVCGDDKGPLWLYHLPAMAQASPAPAPGTTRATTRLMRPEITDKHLNIVRKLPLDGQDIIVDKVAASWDNKHLVAVTSNNMVRSEL